MPYHRKCVFICNGHTPWSGAAPTPGLKKVLCFWWSLGEQIPKSVVQKYLTVIRKYNLPKHEHHNITCKELLSEPLSARLFRGVQVEILSFWECHTIKWMILGVLGVTEMLWGCLVVSRNPEEVWCAPFPALFPISCTASDSVSNPTRSNWIILCVAQG